MSTPTPRTNAAVTLTIGADFNSVCPNFARTLEIELAAATTERDKLRAIFPQICNALGNGAFCTPTVSFGLIESIPNEVQAVVGKLRAEVERLNARAELAEAELAKAKERLRSEAMDDYAAIKDLQRDLAIERARLDWLESNAGVDWQWSDDARLVSRASIDAFMKEGAK